jgi:hypothetical protein
MRLISPRQAQPSRPHFLYGFKGTPPAGDERRRGLEVVPAGAVPSSPHLRDSGQLDLQRRRTSRFEGCPISLHAPGRRPRRGDNREKPWRSDEDHGAPRPDQPDISGAVFLGEPLSRSRPPRLGCPAGVAARSASPKPRPDAHSPGSGAYRGRRSRSGQVRTHGQPLRDSYLSAGAQGASAGSLNGDDHVPARQHGSISAEHSAGVAASAGRSRISSVTCARDTTGACSRSIVANGIDNWGGSGCMPKPVG